MSLAAKVLLAALSGCLVMMLWQTASDPDTAVGMAGFYGLCGGVFAAGVLLPLASRSQVFSWRLPALLVVSGASFYAAIYVATEYSAAMKGPQLIDFVKASLAGAGIVLASIPFILAFRVTLRYGISSLVAAIIAGIVFGLLAETNLYGSMLGFAAWHVAMAGVLHLACPIETADCWLASLPRRRFVAVTGIAALVVVVPLVDDAIGASIRYRYLSSEGGIRIHESFAAYGFRDEREPSIFPSYGCGFACVGRVQDGIYSFQEYEVDHEDGRYTVFFLADESDPNCRRYGGTWQPPIEVTIQGSSQANGRCLTYRVRQNPVAEYAVRDDSRSVDALAGLYSMWRANRQVVRIEDGKLMSEVTYFVYHSRFFGNSIGEIETWREFLAKALPPADGDPPLLQ